jgi:hypothetical protein
MVRRAAPNVRGGGSLAGRSRINRMPFSWNHSARTVITLDLFTLNLFE